MGNQPSKAPTESATPASSRHQKQTPAGTDAPSEHRRPRRRESLQSVLPSHRSAAAAALSASLQGAAGQGAPQPHAAPSHARTRSKTLAGPPPRSGLAPDMGNILSSEEQSVAERERPQPPPLATPSQGLPIDEEGEGVHSPSSPAQYPSAPQFGRPPRLPLPIDEEVLSPGSPISTAEDVVPPDLGDDAPGLRRHGSVLSSRTDEEEDDGDLIDEFAAVGVPPGPVAETLVEWKEGGDRVYVTGTFTGWTKKFRLIKNGPSKDPNVLSAKISLPMGTHHVTFLVDGDMQTARHLPTAVDFTNRLVNYIEITADQVQPLPTQPRNIPHSTPAKQAHERPTAPAAAASLHDPPPAPELRPTSTGPEPPSVSVSASDVPKGAVPSKEKKMVARKFETCEYNSEIPRYLADLDAAEDSSRFQRANAVMATQPAPPSLPMFLNKSILNQATPMKDDNSVLTLPNHTVINHLATSSIKNSVLATSVTTRYKKKYVTTIMYKPTSDKD